MIYKDRCFDRHIVMGIVFDRYLTTDGYALYLPANW